ncbi:FUSC family protein [Pandoraea sp.]|uniref:FUSC family protein n=1 Tax=Pandoraea sp. TaxID=1883445 RepID=UPI00121A3E69|nr:FUSC family protein [Pandoraea sp.]TAL55770.1 MAG: hypothetical protein EPN80_06260 [Pandoraea sp.]TAM19374.1 MAG: hypothetical protein EPN65_03825 [Pandoraea sp.]
MDYPRQIKKFLYSHYFFSGARQAVGVTLPALVLFWGLDQHLLGLAVASGALCASVADVNGPLRHKHIELLACSVLGAATAALTGLSSAHPVTLWLCVGGLSFFLSLLVVYGYRASLVSFACLLIMVLNVETVVSPGAALLNAGAVLAGGLWYTYFSLAVCRVLWFRLEQQTLAECFFATAQYLEAKGAFYDVDQDLDECYRRLIATQVNVVEKQQAAREMILRDLPRLRRGQLDKRRAMLLNLFVNVVDLHEVVVSVHTDYPLLRKTFEHADILIFFRDLIRKAAADVDSVGFAIASDQPARSRSSWKAEFRAIEYEIELLKEKRFQQDMPDAYDALVATFRRVWSTSRQIEKLYRNIQRDGGMPNMETRLDQALNRFVSRQSFSPKLLWHNLTFASPSFRHALRVSIAILGGLALAHFLPLLKGQSHSYWILLTTIVILKPGFSLTKQKNFQRLSGTLIGCLLVLAILFVVHKPWALLGLMFFFMVMGNSLALFNYGLAVVFTSAYVLLLFHFLVPGSILVVGERALDTAIGSLVALVCSYFFPYWEYRLMSPLVRGAVLSTRDYLQSCLGRDGVVDEFAYRMARKNMHIAFANFGAAFKRMMLEPKSKQVSVAELNGLLVQTHVLASHITSISEILARHLLRDKSGELNAAVQAILGMLQQAADAPVAGQRGGDVDPAETLRDFTRRLDALVVHQEQQPGASIEDIQELKLIAHQIKQMLRVGELIFKDMRAMRLPAG